MKESEHTPALRAAIEDETANGGITIRELSERVGCSYQWASIAVRRMLDAGEVSEHGKTGTGATRYVKNTRHNRRAGDRISVRQVSGAVAIVDTVPLIGVDLETARLVGMRFVDDGTVIEVQDVEGRRVWLAAHEPVDESRAG
jgi:hypothetical protein